MISFACYGKRPAQDSAGFDLHELKAEIADSQSWVAMVSSGFSVVVNGQSVLTLSMLQAVVVS